MGEAARASDDAIAAFIHGLDETARRTLVAPVPPRNRNDWSALSPVDPAALFCPRTTEEVSALLAAANEAGVKVVPQGGLTGLCGGARPIPGAIALSLEKMTGVEEIDPASATMTVRAGTPLETVQAAAAEVGLMFPLDLGARGSCAIGGNASTNAGGNRVIRYGMTRDLILGLEAVLPDGRVVNALSKLIKNNTGYDVRQLFIGAEGTLGVITRLVLRLVPQPASTFAAIVGVADYDKVLALLSGARRKLGPMLSAFEAMWSDYWEVATAVEGVRDPLAERHPFTILVESQGTDADLDGQRFERFLEEMYEAGVVADAALAQSLTDVKAFWGTRDAASEFKTILGPHLAFDVGLPTGRMDAFAIGCRAALERHVPGARSVYYGHIGDGNLHLLAWLPGAAEQPAGPIDAAVYETVAAFGGSVSAEHGIGLSKKAYLALSRSPAELDLMRTIRRAVDPRGTLNPGKVFD